MQKLIYEREVCRINTRAGIDVSVGTADGKYRLYIGDKKAAEVEGDDQERIRHLATYVQLVQGLNS